MVGVWDIVILHINCEDLSNHFAHAKIKSKSREIFTEECGNLINATEMCKHHLVFVQVWKIYLGFKST